MFALRGAREVKADTCAATAALVSDLAAATGITAVRVQEAFVVAVELSSWLAEPAVHRSHQSALVRKLAHFRRFFPDVPDRRSSLRVAAVRPGGAGTGAA